MKKLISVLISIIAVFAVCTAFAVPAFAAVDVYSPQGTKIEHSVNDPKLNSSSSNQVTGASVSAGSNKITFSYTGSGTVDRWTVIDANGKVTEIDNNSPYYKVISNDGKTITIEVLDWSYFEGANAHTFNVITKDGASSNGTKNDSSKSPSTGAVSVAFASMAVAGAGASILALTKKKNAE